MGTAIPSAPSGSLMTGHPPCTPDRTTQHKQWGSAHRVAACQTAVSCEASGCLLTKRPRLRQHHPVQGLYSQTPADAGRLYSPRTVRLCVTVSSMHCASITMFATYAPASARGLCLGNTCPRYSWQPQPGASVAKFVILWKYFPPSWCLAPMGPAY